MSNTWKDKLLSAKSITITALVASYIIVAAMLYSGNITRQLTSLLIPISVYIVMAVSLNLVVGFLGELSLGHAGFMSVGLFTGCIFSIYTAELLPMIFRLPLSMLIGGFAAAIFGFVVGLPALRLRGDYLAIVTLGCGEIIKNIITNLKITGGALGLNTRAIYSSTKTLLPYAAVLVILTVIMIINFSRSKHGRAITAIRDNLIAAESTGVDTTYYKLMVFVLAAAFAGMAGVLYGHSLANIKAAAFDYNMSIEILVIVVLGRMGSIGGSIIAAVILTVLPEAMREFSDYRMLAYSVALILIMVLGENPRIKRLFVFGKRSGEGARL